MPGIHRQKRHFGHLQAHCTGVVGGNAGGTQTLQIQCLEIDEVEQRTRYPEHRLTSANQIAFRAKYLDLELGIPLGRSLGEDVEGETRRGQDRSTHEYGVGNRHVAITADDFLRPQKIMIGEPFDLARPRLTTGFTHRRRPGQRHTGFRRYDARAGRAALWAIA